MAWIALGAAVCTQDADFDAAVAGGLLEAVRM